jgi:hypothetical protein
VVNEPFPDDVIVTGATFKLVGNGWPADTLIELEVCGNEARSGSSDCAVETAQIVASDALGSFRARVSVVIPPTACPCVLRAVSQADGSVATAPAEIPGAPVKALDDSDVVKPAVRSLEVHDVSLIGSDDWQVWLGGHPRRTLEFTVINTGDVALTDATVSLSIGSSDDPTGFVAPVELGRLDVMQKRTYRIPVSFDALAFGRQFVKGSFTGTTEPTTFSAATSSYPWLLIAIPAVLLVQTTLVVSRNLARRRLHRRGSGGSDASTVGAGPVDPEPSGHAVTAIEAGEAVGIDESSSETVLDVDVADAARVAPASEPAGFGQPVLLMLPDGETGEDECIICVLEFVTDEHEPSTTERTMTVVRGLDATKLALLEHVDLPGVTGEPVPSGHRRRIDVVSILGVDQATVREAHEASVQLGKWIEAHLGLSRYVPNGRTVADLLFRCEGVPAVIDEVDPTTSASFNGWSGAAETYTSIFFSGQTTEVDLHGLIPLVVYARRDPSARVTPRRHSTTEADGCEARQIRSMGEMIDHLLSFGESSDDVVEREDDRPAVESAFSWSAPRLGQ